MDGLTDKAEIAKKSAERAAEEKAALNGSTENLSDAELLDKEESAYFLQNGFWSRTKQTNQGRVIIPLCNFTAKITAENIIDDGQDINQFFVIEGLLNGNAPLPLLEIEAAKFNTMSWITRWGSKPCLEPGQTVKDFVRHAIQKSSNGVQVTTHYAHTGWRKIGGEWFYLHAGGAIGNTNGGVTVRLPRELQKYFFSSLPPVPPQTNCIPKMTPADALKASLEFLDIGDHKVTLPLFCLAYLAPLTTLLNQKPNFAGYEYGPSGSLKTTLAILLLCHFGDFRSVENLSNFDDTVGILEKRSFILKDTLHICDDFHPSHQKHNALNRENTVQRLIRNYSNRTARGRLNSDLSEKGRYEPRGILLITAEEIPSLESTLARVCVVEVLPDSIDREKLSALQKKACLLSTAMQDYILWIRDNMESLVSGFPERFFELRQQAAAESWHRKLPEQAAFLGFALETAVSFFYDRGILTEKQGDELIDQGWRIFRALAEKQSRRISEDDPVSLFFDIIATLIIQDEARIEPLPGFTGERIGHGHQIGWYDENYLYLMPAAAWEVVQRHCRDSNIYFPFSKTTHFQMLKNQKIIQPANDGKTSIQVKIYGKPVRVLKVIDRGIFEKCVTKDTNDNN